MRNATSNINRTNSKYTAALIKLSNMLQVVLKIKSDCLTTIGAEETRANSL